MLLELFPHLLSTRLVPLIVGTVGVADIGDGTDGDVGKNIGIFLIMSLNEGAAQLRVRKRRSIRECDGGNKANKKSGKVGDFHDDDEESGVVPRVEGERRGVGMVGYKRTQVG